MLLQLLRGVALDPKQRSGVVLASDPSLCLWPEGSQGQPSSGGISGTTLNLGTWLSFYMDHEGAVQVQINGWPSSV